jgi:hypothetical protein
MYRRERGKRGESVYSVYREREGGERGESVHSVFSGESL